jgi:hypothetical protein
VNLQIVSDALDSGQDTLGQLRLDMDMLTREAKDWFKNMKTGLGGAHIRPPRAATNPLEKQPRTKEIRPEKLIPKNWLSYSWQHNLRDGLISLAAGVGLGIALYYVGQIAIQSGTMQDIQEIAGRELRGVESLLGIIWIFALIPVLKGLAQIFYAAFFAESIATLTERFLPHLQPRQIVAPPDFASMTEPPSSVTEHTTQIFAETPPQSEV